MYIQKQRPNTVQFSEAFLFKNSSYIFMQKEIASREDSGSSQ